MRRGFDVVTTRVSECFAMDSAGIRIFWQKYEKFIRMSLLDFFFF